MRSIDVDNAGVRLHALDGGRDGDRAPLLVVPGFGEEAREYTWLSEQLDDRRVVIVDVRGRGGSSVPDAGYTWADHWGDVLAVMRHSGVERPVVIANSRGTAYALGAALHSPEPLRGLVINDYQARQAGLSPDMADALRSMRIRGTPVSDRLPEHVIKAVITDAEEIPLWDRLTELQHPIVVMRGSRSGIVDDEAVERYRRARPDIEIVTMEGRGHDLWNADIGAYLAVVRPFLDAIDTGASLPDGDVGAERPQ